MCPAMDNVEASASHCRPEVLTVCLATAVLFLMLAVRRYSSKKCVPGGLRTAPGPLGFPVIGSLHLLGEYDVKNQISFAAFTDLMAKYGSVFSIRLGTTDCVVLNDIKSRDEMLVAKQNDFDGRPDFDRFTLLFGGDKQNALAFCDYSNLQQHRREMLQKFTLPYSHSGNWGQLDAICQEECAHMIESIKASLGSDLAGTYDVRPVVMKASANIFNRYFCGSQRFDYDDEKLCSYVDNFDKIFWEVNTGRLCDFVPALVSTAYFPIRDARRCAKKVRQFVDDEIIAPRQETLKKMGDEEKSSNSAVFLDGLMPYLSEGQKNSVGMNQSKAMYALEDILGGFCAVGCMTVRILRDLADHAHTQAPIIEELAHLEARHPERPVYSMQNQHLWHWSRAAVFETIRLTCSPIVPHRATKDSSIGDFFIKKDTVVFVNNHNLSFSPELWKEGRTTEYFPRRFLKADCRSGNASGWSSQASSDDGGSVPSAAAINADANRKNFVFGDNSSDSGIDDDDAMHNGDLRFRRPGHFKPFSFGKRSCMGYKMVENVCTAMAVALVDAFHMETRPEERREKLKPGVLGLPDEPVKMFVAFRD